MTAHKDSYHRITHPEQAAPGGGLQFPVVFEGCSRRAVDCRAGARAEIRSLRASFSGPVDFGLFGAEPHSTDFIQDL